MILPIYTDTQTVLYQKAEQISEITPEITQLISDMRETMHNAQGVGIAAPQVGKSVSLCIIELTDEDQAEQIPFTVLINPRVTWSSKRQVRMEEACLSVPGFEGTIKRPDKIRVKALSVTGEKIEIEASDFFARVLQHEIDHLDGILFTSYLPKKQLRTKPLIEYPRV